VLLPLLLLLVLFLLLVLLLLTIAVQSFPAMITGVAMFELLLMFLILRFEYNEHRGSARGEYAAVAIGEGEGDGDALSEREEAIERDVARATD